MEIEKEFLQVKDVAKKLDVSLKTVYRLIENGELPSYPINKLALRIKASDLEDYLERIRKP